MAVHATNQAFMATTDPLIVADRFAPASSWERRQSLGSGGFAQVYQAIDHATGKLVAVKTAITAEAAALLRREEEILTLLQGCPYIVSCLGHDGTHGDLPYKDHYNLFLEYAPCDLAHYINRHGGQLSENSIRRLTRDLLRGLDFIHDRGYVHCDIKPQNLLVWKKKTEKGVIPTLKIADFGLARKVEDRLEKNFEGTMQYMSPESWSNQCEPPMDVWALGLVVIEMFTGRPAYEVPAGMHQFSLRSKSIPRL